MSDYISREAALELLKLIEYKESSINFAGTMIRELQDMPAADVAPVRHGRWKYQTMTVPGGRGQTYYRYSCSVCKQKEKTRTIYCPNCGAKMEETE